MRRTALVIAMLTGLAAPAGAFEGFVGARALGMGGASRAFATDGTALLLNPSGMSLDKSYHVDSDYGFSSPRSGHYFHSSVVDSTSAITLAGGLYYTYHANYPDQLPAGHGHEAGLALSLPFTERVALGGTVKYLYLQGDQTAGGHGGGLTFDAGVTVRPLPVLSLAFVGMNLRDLHNGEAARGIGYGVAVLPLPDLVLAADGVTQFTADGHTGRKGTSLMAGGDLLMAERFDARLGGGYDALSGNSYASAGVSLIGGIGAFDVGVRQDLTRGEIAPGVPSPRATILGVALRLFVEADQPPP